ncbi:MAG: hypothetical protein PHH98_01600 [Candidatus Gracilibacteria bacterium]|nr:hypothetical protein [Candidatus Gracilibacteria bacterium]
MVKLTKNINGTISLERNNTITNIVYKNNKILLSKKDIAIHFGEKKSTIKDIIEQLHIVNSELLYNKNKDKNIKLYSIDSILIIGYKLKKYSETKLLIKTNRILKNTSFSNSTILELVKAKYSEIKNKLKIIDLMN